MPHSRDRLVIPALKKRLSFFRIVSLQGARQTGKSFLASKILKQVFPRSQSVTFDSKNIRDQAQESPDTFLELHESAAPFIIDEAQKAPNIFDAVKLRVDSDPRPGQYILLGSTEFSQELKIRESLTGRLGRIRLFPLCFQELIGTDQPAQGSRSQFLHWLETGGLPGIAFVRSKEERGLLFEDWLQLVCTRDIHQIQKWKLDSDLAYEILRLTCTLEEPSALEISKRLRQSTRRVQTHLNALELLFTVQKISPHPSGKGKAIYLALDSGLAHYLGADLRKKAQIAMMNEVLCWSHYQHQKKINLYFYRSKSKRKIDLIFGENPEKCTAYQFFDSEHIPGTELEILNAFHKKVPNSRLIAYAPIKETQNLKKLKIEIKPWETMPFKHSK